MQEEGKLNLPTLVENSQVSAAGMNHHNLIPPV